MDLRIENNVMLNDCHQGQKNMDASSFTFMLET